jgi:hypothetical protein
VLSQCANQPTIGDTLRGVGICGPNGIKCLMQQAGIGFPMEVHECTRYLRIDIVGSIFNARSNTDFSSA